MYTFKWFAVKNKDNSPVYKGPPIDIASICRKSHVYTEYDMTSKLTFPSRFAFL